MKIYLHGLINKRFLMDFIKLLEEESSPKTKPSSVAYVFGAVISGLTIVITVTSFPFILPFFRRVCLPYVPATTQQVENVLEALKGRSGKLIDLGSGDGRIVLAAAQNGFHSTGIELNPCLVAYSKLSSFCSGLHKTSKFYRKNLWTFNLKPYRNVVVFGVESMMKDLEKKFLKELEEGTQIIACRFPLPNMKPVKTLGFGIDQVWIYICRKS